MKYRAVLAIVMSLAAGIACAQESPLKQVPSTSTESTFPVEKQQMTPRETAEIRADILMARKKYAAAAAAYERILAENRTSKSSLLGKIARIFPFFHHTPAKDKENAVLLNKIGIAYHQLGELDRAEHYYKMAWDADRHFASPINNLGTLEYARGNYGRAIKYFNKALATRQNMAPIYTNLGYAYFGDKRYPQAVQAFDKALAIDPQVFEHRGGSGPIMQQRSTTHPGELNFMLAKSFARAGDAARAALYLKMARDDGYKNYRSAKTDPDFAKVIKDPRVQRVLRVIPPFVNAESEPARH